MSSFVKQMGMAILLGLPLVFGSTAFAVDLPEDFDTLDLNGDQQVSFSEFLTLARNQNVGTTLAAQNFTKISAGSAVIKRADFVRAKHGDSRSRRNESYTLRPMTEDVSVVNRANLTAMEPVETEPSTLEKTPNEEVAGEVIRTFEDNRRVDDLIRYSRS